jgi:predicted RNase H-like HicB family nuclease
LLIEGLDRSALDEGAGSGRVIGRCRMKLKVVLERSDEGGFTAYVPSLPGCISEGETREEALQNIRKAIELYLEPVEDDTALGEQAELVELAL